jgi:acetyl-CoA carboxylase carboxyl transferase subunit alpha
MGVTTAQISKLNILDAILPEPMGGAHRDPEAMAKTISEYLEKELKTLSRLSSEQLLKQRQEKLLKF